MTQFTTICLTILIALSTATCSAESKVREFTTEHHPIEIEIVADGLSYPWGIAFLPDSSSLITERTGSLRHLSSEGLSAPISGVPKVRAAGQGGLLDVAIDPKFEQNQTIYLSYSEPSEDGDEAGTAVARAHLIRAPTPHLKNVQVIFSQNKKSGGKRHFGSRLVITPDRKLFITQGDRGDRPRAQDPFDHAGSIVRLNPDGSIPKDNPFADGTQAMREIWSIGHRNIQGATWHSGTESLWTVEHGARGGDEINHPRSGRNYGWPVISYGRHYRGTKIGEGTHKAGMEQPVHYWDPSIAPSGLAYYDGKAFPKWQGNLFIGALKDQMLVRLELEGERVVHEEHLLKEKFGRIRDVRQGPDGYLYLLTDSDNGKLLRIKPAN